MQNEEKILGLLEQLVEDVSGLKQDVSGLKQDVSGLKQDVSGLKQESAETKKELVALKEQMGRMDERLRRVELTQENMVLPQLRLLAEGNDTLLARSAPVERVEAVETDVDMLKTVVRLHSQDISALKKAR